jgi:hypothetical protein
MTDMPRPATSEYLLSTRRALLGDPNSLQVHEWLRPIYHRPPSAFSLSVAKSTISGMVSLLEPAVKTNARLKTALNGVSRYIAAPLGKQYVQGFDSIKRPYASVFGTFVSVVYARAILLLVSSVMDGPKIVADMKNILTKPDAAIEKYQDAQGKLGEHFVGHLVTSAEIEVQVDPHFQNLLDRAGRLFVEAHKPKDGGRNPFADTASPIELLGEEDESAWWRLPANLAFAMTIAN